MDSAPAPTTRLRLRPVLLAILLVALVPRLVHLDFPVAGWHAWRQADTAAMARNFHAGGHRLLHPQVDWGGAGAGYVESEFPLYPWLVSLLYAAFGPRDLWGRLVSVLCSLATVVVVWKLVRRRLSEREAAWAALVYAVAPLDVFYGRAFMPEAAMLLASALGVYGFMVWMDGGRGRDAALAWLGVTLAALLKLPALYLGLPLAYLAWERWGAAAWRRPALWGFAALVLLPVGLWYGHAHRLYVDGGVTFAIWGFGTDKWGNLDLLVQPGFYADVFLKSLAERHLTYAGCIPFVVGLLLPRHGRRERLFDVWLLAVVVYILIVARGNRVHEYYQLPFMLPASVFAGRALARFLPEPGRVQRPRPLLAGLFAACVVGLFVLSGLRYERLLRREDRDAALFRLAAAVERWTRADERVVAVNGGNPIVLYRCGRKGWNSSPEQLDAEFLADKQRQGARYVLGEKSIFHGDAGRAQLRDLLARYERVENDPDYFILRLGGE